MNSAAVESLKMRCRGDEGRLQRVSRFLQQVQFDEKGRVTAFKGLPVVYQAQVEQVLVDAISFNASLKIGEHWIVRGGSRAPNAEGAALWRRLVGEEEQQPDLILGFLAVLLAEGNMDLELQMVNAWGKAGEVLPWDEGF